MTEGKTYTEADMLKLDERAKRFEGQVADLEKKVKAFGDITPDHIHAMREELDSLKKANTGVPKDKQDELEALLKKKYDDQIKALSDRAEAAEKERDAERGQMKTLKIKTAVLPKLSEIFNSDSAALIEREVLSACDIDGDTIIIKDKDGKIRSAKDGKGNMSPDQFLGELAEKFPSCAKPTNKNGTMNGNERKYNGGGDVSLGQYQKMSKAEKMALPEEQFQKLNKAALETR